MVSGAGRRSSLGPEESNSVVAAEVVDEGSVGAEGLFGGAFELVLLDEVPAVGRAARFKEVGEGGAGVAFGVVAVKVELGEGGVVGSNGFVRWFETEKRWHTGLRER